MFRPIIWVCTLWVKFPYFGTQSATATADNLQHQVSVHNKMP